MTKPRIPPLWATLRPGDTIHSRLPLHRIEAISRLLPDYRFTFIPSPKGYHVRCEAAPIAPNLRVVK